MRITLKYFSMYVREGINREEGNCYVHEKFAISISEL